MMEFSEKQKNGAGTLGLCGKSGNGMLGCCCSGCAGKIKIE